MYLCVRFSTGTQIHFVHIYSVVTTSEKFSKKVRTGEHGLFLALFSQLTSPLWLFGPKTRENERLATRLVREGICVRPILAKNRTLSFVGPFVGPRDCLRGTRCGKCALLAVAVKAARSLGVGYPTNTVPLSALSTVGCTATKTTPPTETLSGVLLCIDYKVFSSGYRSSLLGLASCRSLCRVLL